MLIACAGAAGAHAERLKDLAQIQGVRDNPLIGYGLVVGLDGTGDQTMQTPFTTQTLANMLANLGISINNGSANGGSSSLNNMQLKNVAAVMVTATLPPFARPGEALDVTVSSLGNAKSLRGGTLLLTPLKGADGQVYALAQGNMAVGGAGASANGSRVQVNQLAAGRIAGGAIVERSVPNAVAQMNGVLQLQLNDMDYGTAQRIVSAVNSSFGRHRDGARRPHDPARGAGRPVAAGRVHGAPAEPRREPGQGGREGDPQRAHRLDRDEPDGHAAKLRGRARQPVGGRQHAAGGVAAGAVLERADGGRAAVADPAEAGQRLAEDGDGRREPRRRREGTEHARRDAGRPDVDPAGDEGGGALRADLEII
jgi:hypothetical protein